MIVLPSVISGWPCVDPDDPAVLRKISAPELIYPAWPTEALASMILVNAAFGLSALPSSNI